MAEDKKKSAHNLTSVSLSTYASACTVIMAQLHDSYDASTNHDALLDGFRKNSYTS